MDANELASLLRSQGYDVRGIRHTPQNGLPPQSFVLVDGHHKKLAIYGSISFVMGGIWHNPETEITVAPPEVYYG